MTLKGSSRDFQRRTRDLQGTSRDLQGSPRTLQGPPRDAPMDLQGRLRDASKRASLCSHSQVLRAGTHQGPSEGLPKTFRDHQRLSRDLPGIHKAPSRDFQGRTRDLQGASRDPQGSPRSSQGPCRTGCLQVQLPVRLLACVTACL